MHVLRQERKIYSMNHKKKRKISSKYNNPIIKMSSNIKDINVDDNNINNAYDTDKVNEVLDIYIDLCNDYEKVVNIVGFTFFTGIHRDTLNGWVNGVQLGSSGSDICKKIDEMREESLVGLQVSGKGNPMNYMPSLNKYCGFNMPGVRDQGARARALTASELPKLGSGNCARLPDNFDNSSPDNGEIVIDNSNNLKPSV